jgi:hypothetical protein
LRVVEVLRGVLDALDVADGSAAASARTQRSNEIRDVLGLDSLAHAERHVADAYLIQPVLHCPVTRTGNSSVDELRCRRSFVTQ